MGCVFFGFIWWSQPSEKQLAEMARQDSIAAVEKQQAEKAQATAALKAKKAAEEALEDTTALFHSALKGQSEKIVLQNEKIALTFNTKGATVEKAVIKGYADCRGNKDVTLFQGEDQKLNYCLSAKEQNIETANLYFTPTEKTDSSVVFVATAAPGKTIEMSYQLGKDYMLHMQLRAIGMAGLFSANTNTMDVDWKDKCAQQEKGFTFENRYSTLTYHKSKGGDKKLSETSEKIDETIEDKIDWVAFKNQFFSAVMIAKSDFAENSSMTSIPLKKGSGYLKQFEAKMKTAFDPKGIEASEFEFIYGPNDFSVMKDLEKQSNFDKDLQLTRIAYLG